MWVMPDAGALVPSPALPAVRVAEETLLGFDFGTKRIGVSLGNTLTRSARPLEIIASEPINARFARIEALLAEWQPDRVVVGLAVTGADEHVASVAGLANVFNERTAIERLASASTIDEVRRVFDAGHDAGRAVTDAAGAPS